MPRTVDTGTKTFVAILLAVVAAVGLGRLLRADVPLVPSNTWAAASDMAQARAGAASSLLYDGYVLVTGGRDDGGVTKSSERYSPEAQGFIPAADMESARANHTSTLLPDGRVLVAGGVGAGGAVASAEVYDPVANAWHVVAPMHVARAGHTATALYDGRVVIAGGDDGGNSIGSIEIYDPLSESFERVDAQLSAPRSGHAAAQTYDGLVLIAGGYDGANFLASIDTFDPFSNTVTPAPSLVTARAGLSATPLLDGKILLLGGVGAAGELGSGEIFDPTMNTIGATANTMTTPRQRHQAILLPHNNQVLIIGGTNGSNAVAGAEVYVQWQGDGGSFFPTTVPADVASDGTTTPRVPGTARAWATTAALSQPSGKTIRTGPHDGLMLLTGGSAKPDANSPFPSSELYGFATVKTDKADYAPGERVTITGDGWAANDIVTLTLVEEPLHDTHTLAYVTADMSGRFSSSEFVPDESDRGVRFYLTASGAQSQAQTSFKDGDVSGDLQGQNNPPCASPSPCPWQTTNVTGWQELQTAPVRLFFAANQQTTPVATFNIGIDHAAGATPGFESLQFVSKTANVVMGPISLTKSSNGNTWTYTFTVDMTDNNSGEIQFSTRLAAGAHSFTGASLQIKGAGTLSFVKPAAAPGSPDLVLTKTGLTSVAPGQTMTYTLSYQNTATGANGATGAQITDVLPAEVTYVAGSCVGCVYDSLSRTLRWDLGTIAAGSALATRTYQVTVGSSLSNNTTFSNDARILSAENDANINDNASKVTTTAYVPSISGTVIDDVNGNGVVDVTDGGLAGATVKLFVDTNTNGVFDSGSDVQVGSTTITSASGQWTFANVTGLVINKTYFVVRTNPAGYTSTQAFAGSGTNSTATKVNNDQIKVVLGANPASSANNQFLASGSNGSITGTLYNDADGSGTFTAGDTSLGTGIAVNLTGTSSAATTTDASGVFSFSGLGAGTFTVDYALPTGYAATSTKPLTGITLAAGATSSGNNFFARRTTSTTLARTAGSSPSVYGDSLTFSASVTSLSGTNPTNQGTVIFKDGGVAIPTCSSVVLSGGAATCTISALSVSGSVHSITAEYSGSASSPGFSGSTSATVNQSVTQKLLNVTADDKTKTYDGGTFTAFTASYSGFVNSETSSALGGTLSFIGAATTATAAGGYAITPGGLTSSNYDIHFLNGTLTISQASSQVVITWNNSNYSGTPNSASAVVQDSSNAPIPAATATFAYYNGTTATGSPLAGAPTNVGTYTVRASYNGTGTNYSSSFADKTITVSPAALSITADADVATAAADPFTKPYDGQVFTAFTTRYSGFVNSETPAALTGALSFSGAGTTATAAGGPYAVTPGGQTSSNYNITFVAGTLTITKVALSITADADVATAAVDPFTKPYDGQAFTAFTARYSGFVNSETPAALTGALSFSGAGTTATAAGGPNAVTPGGLTSSNYNITFVSGALTIGARTLTAAITGDPTKPYDGNTAATLAAANFALSTVVAGESISVTQTSGSYNSANVAAANTVSATLAAANFTAGAGTDLANYVLPTTASGAGHITARTLTAAISGDPTKPYDGNTTATLAAANFALGTVVAGESISVTQTSGSYNSANVAAANTVSATLAAANFTAGAGTDLANYVLPTAASGAGHITARTLTAAISGDPTKPYDGNATATLTAANFALSTVVAGESISVTQTSGSYNSANVAAANTVSATLVAANFTAGAGTDLANYVLPTTASGAGHITGRTLTAAIGGDPTKPYDGNATATLTAANFALSTVVAGESISVTQTSGSYNSANVAAANTVSATLVAANFTAGAGTDLANYVLPTTASGAGHITGRTLTAAIGGDPTKPYDGNATATLTAANFALSTVVAGESISVTQTSGSYNSANVAAANTVSATLVAANFTAGAGTDLANYVLPTTASGAGHITGRTLTAAIGGDPTKPYDGNATATLTAANFALSTVVAGESISVTQTSGSYNSASVAAANTVSATLVAANFTSGAGTDLGNYDLPVGATGPGHIAKADPTIVVTPYSVPYDATAHTATGTAKGVLNESLAGLVLTGTTHTAAGLFATDAWTFTDVTGNYNDKSGTVSDAIAKADPTIVVTPYDVIFNAAAHTATGAATGIGGVVLSGLDLSGTTHTAAGTTTDTWVFTDVTGNYNNATSTVVDKIAKADASITVTPYDVTFNGAAHTATGSATGIGAVILSGLDLSGTTHTAAGTTTDTWVFTDVTGNYNNATSTVVDKIAKADASITVTPYDVTFNGAAHTATGSATGIGAVILSGLDLSGTTHTAAGTTTDSWVFTDVTGNYNNATSTVVDKIAKADASITVTPYDVTFNGAAHTATGAATGIGAVILSGLDLSGTTHTAAGTTTDTWVFTDVTGNYNNATSTVVDKIAKADASITVTPYDVTFNGAAHTATGSATGIGAVILSGLDLSGTTHTAAGTTTDTWTFTDVTGNYNNATSTVVDKIAKADASITVTPYDVTFNGAAHTATGSATGIGAVILSGLDLSGTTHTAAGTTTDSWTFTDVTGNYNNATSTVVDKIAKADASITVTPYDVTFNGAAHTATGAATGIGAVILSGLDLSGTTHTAAGTTTDSWTFTDVTGNYNNATSTVVDKIAKADAVVTVAGFSGPFDNTAHGATGSVTGVGGAPISGLAVATTTYTNVPGGLVHWTFSNANYESQSGNATVTISAKGVTVTAVAKSKTYGEDDPPLTYTPGALNAGDSFTGSLARAAGENVGSYAINQGSVTAGPNYTIAFSGADLTISAKGVTVTATAQTKVYSGTDPGLTYGVAPALKSGDSFTGSLTRLAGENVGTYAISQGTLSAGTNYSITFVGGNLTIKEKPVTVTATAQTKVYGGTDPALTFGVAPALKYGDNFTGNLTRLAGENVGAYAISQGTLSAGTNYTLTFVGANLTITQRSVTVTADAKEKILGAVDPPLTYNITSGSLVSGDAFSGSLTRDAGEAVGTYPIKVGTLTLGANYTLAFSGANLKIVFLWDGFLQPINDTAHDVHTTAPFSKFKLGQTIPAKFDLKDVNGNTVTQIANPTFNFAKIANSCTDYVEPETLDMAYAPSSVPIFVLSGGHYQYNWSTKGTIQAGLYAVYAGNLADGTTKTVNICLAK